MGGDRTGLGEGWARHLPWLEAHSALEVSFPPRGFAAGAAPLRRHLLLKRPPWEFGGAFSLHVRAASTTIEENKPYAMVHNSKAYQKHLSPLHPQQQLSVPTFIAIKGRDI